MLPMPFSRRRRERKALRVARLLVALDDVAGERRARASQPVSLARHERGSPPGPTRTPPSRPRLASSGRALGGSRECRRREQERPERLGLVELPLRPVGELELGEDLARLARPGVLARLPERSRGARAAPRSRPACRRAGGRRAAARRCRSSGSPSGGRRCRGARARRAGRAAAPRPNAIAEPASRPLWRIRKRRCLPSPTTPGCTASQPATSSVTSGLPRPNGASRSSSVARPSVSGRPAARSRRSGSRARDRPSSRTASACAANAAANASRSDGSIESPAAARWPPKRSQVLRAGAERAVQVERRQRAARALPVAVAAGDQDDRPVEALDEARGDDPDHALVPVLAPDHVAAPAALRARATTRPRRSRRAGSGPRRPGGRGSASRARRRAASPRPRRS